MKSAPFVLGNTLKRKMLKFDSRAGKVIAQDVPLIKFFTNKKVLMVYPYPSKERLNSAMYDDILKKLQIAKEVNNNENSSQNMHNGKSAEKEIVEKNKNSAILSNEIYKIKYLKQLDEIVGLSEMDEKNTEEFIHHSKVPDVWFLVDPNKSINNLNQLNDRYEILIDNMKIEEYRSDPNLVQNIILGSIVGYMIFGCFMLSIISFAYIYTTSKSNETTFDKIYKSI